MLSSSSSSFISDTRSIGITIKQHRGQTGNIQKYTQQGISNTESERNNDISYKFNIKHVKHRINGREAIERITYWQSSSTSFELSEQE